MHNLEPAEASRERLVECVQNLVASLLPGFARVRHVYFENAPECLSGHEAIALRAHPHPELLEGKSTLRTLAHGWIESGKLATEHFQVA